MAFAISAVASAIAAPTLMSVLGAVAAVGTATSVVGIATGKSNLIKIGGELGLVGGLGSLAAGALASSAANIAGVAEGATEAAYSDVAAEKFAASEAANAAASNASNAAATSGATSAAESAAPSFIQPNSSATSIFGAGQTSAGVPGISPNAGGMYDVTGDKLMAGAGQNFDSLTKPSDFSSSIQKGYVPSDVSAVSDVSQLDKFKASMGDSWNKLTPQVQAEVAKSMLAIPSGIQAQKNMNAQLDIANQRTKQTSYGSQVPTFGIINKAMRG